MNTEMSECERRQREEMERCEPLFEKRIKERLQHRLWDAVENITGEYWTSVRRYSIAEVQAYADGIMHSLEWMAEQFCVDLPARGQLRAAVGELQRRRQLEWGPAKPSRGLMGLLEEVRDARIAMVEQYQKVDYAKEKEWGKRLRTYERQARNRPPMANEAADRKRDMELWEELEQVRSEIRAANEYFLHLIGDRSWFSKYYELTHPRLPQPIEEAA